MAYILQDVVPLVFIVCICAASFEQVNLLLLEGLGSALHDLLDC